MVSVLFFFSFLPCDSCGLIFFNPQSLFPFSFALVHFLYISVHSSLWFPFLSLHHVLLSSALLAPVSLKSRLPFTLPALFCVSTRKRPEVTTRCKQTFQQTHLTCDSFSQINLVNQHTSSAFTRGFRFTGKPQKVFKY